MARIPVDLFEDKAQIITLTWNKDDAKEVETARRRFEEYLKKGLIAFIDTPDGVKIRVYKFEKDYQKVELARLVEGG